MIRLIAAIDTKSGIAKNGGQPWFIPADEQYFTEQTKNFGGNVLVGGVTFRDSLKSQPLSDRKLFLLTRNESEIDDVTLVHDLKKFLDEFKDTDLWVIGGASLFEAVIDMGKADELYLTHIEADFRCDQVFPKYQDEFKLVGQQEPLEENGFKFYFARYSR